MNRCNWCNLKNPIYIKYHDEEWGILNTNDNYLYEMLILESFQAGLSWECVLNKREAFRKAYENFDINKVCNYDDNKIEELIKNKNIIRNKLKIKASINNSKIFKQIIKENGTFYNYLLTFTKGNIYYNSVDTRSKLSDDISKDLTKRGMKFVGTTIIFSYLQAVGIINSHQENCFLEIVGTGPITSEQVKKVFQEKIEKVNYLITDCKSSYEKFAKENNINLEQVKSGTYVNQNGYSLGNINSLHSELTTFLSCFKGVSTKHLQHYLDWFCFQKLINYTTEILKQPLTMMKQTTINSCTINSNNIYDNTSGINFKKVYSDYNFPPLTI